MRSAKERKMGRPRTIEPRDRQFNLSLTATEFAGIKRRAEEVGMRPVYFGRLLLLGGADKAAIRTETERTTARLIYGQLVRLGNNLNQMVRHLHRTGDPLPADLDSLLNDIRKIIARVP
jgi:hypothetical protein